MNTPYILVLFYSRHGHTQRLAEFIAQGIESVRGVEARLRTVPAVAVQRRSACHLYLWMVLHMPAWMI